MQEMEETRGLIDQTNRHVSTSNRLPFVKILAHLHG